VLVVPRPGYQVGDLSCQRRRRVQAVVDGEMRSFRFRAEPDPAGELREAGQLGRVALQPAGGQPAPGGPATTQAGAGSLICFVPDVDE
jgi:hypothetical protein